MFHLRRSGFSHGSVLSVVLLLCISVSNAQADFTNSNAKVDTMLDKWLNAGLFPGAAVMVSYNDTVIYARGFGFADLQQKVPVNPFQTKFRIASITKIMTAAVIAKLVGSGKMDFNASPHQYLDSLAPTKYKFTIDNLGSHLSGLSRNPTGERYDCVNPYRRSDFYQVFEKDTFSQPLTRYQYSNYAYKLLGLVAEKVTRQSITSLHKKHVTGPLKLTSTIPDIGMYDDETAVFYTKNKKSGFGVATCFDCSFMYAEGCYLSTAADLIRLGNALLFQNRLLEKDMLVRLLKSRKLADGRNTGYGFGFNSEKDEFGNYYFGHNGLLPGARSTLKIYPGSKLVVVVLTNVVVSDLDSGASQIAKHYIREIGKLDQKP